MSSLDQMKENCETFADFEPIVSEERRFLMRMAREIRKTTAIDCSFCNYCVKECEMNIPIPDLFNLYNSEKMYSLVANHANYGTISTTYAPASACIECGDCVDICTQQLNIPELLKDVVELFE